MDCVNPRVTETTAVYYLMKMITSQNVTIQQFKRILLRVKVLQILLKGETGNILAAFSHFTSHTRIQVWIRNAVNSTKEQCLLHTGLIQSSYVPGFHPCDPS